MTATALIFDSSSQRRRNLARNIEATSLFSDISFCSNATGTLRELEKNSVDVIFYGSDRLSKKKLAWINRLNTSGDCLDIPVVAFSNNKCDKEVIFGIESGASDCLPFDTPVRELTARLRRHLARKMRLQELKKANEELARMTITDPLTGLGNRRHFDDTLRVETKRSDRSKTPFSLLMVDIDHFKNINDTIGHQGGDQVLKQVAGLLQKSFRNYDTVCRFGGEEFSIIMPGADDSNAYVIAERIRGEMSQLNSDCSMGNFPLTVSIGMRCVGAGESITPARMIEEADKALYRAKNLGRNRTETFRPAKESPSMTSSPPSLFPSFSKSMHPRKTVPAFS